MNQEKKISHRITGSVPRQDGYFMPGEFARQQRILMLWPERPDIWRNQAGPAGEAFAAVAAAVSAFEPVTVYAGERQFSRCRAMLPAAVSVEILETDDAWMRDVGPTFLIDGKGGLRACDWKFNAWGGDYDGLYDSWEKDDRAAAAILNGMGTDYYRTDDFVLEGGSIHTDGDGTVLTTEMCLLSPGRNPLYKKEAIEAKLKDYLNADKIIWIKDGIDPDETNGHIDDVACFARPGETVCIETDDTAHPFYKAAREASELLKNAEDAEGRLLKVHPLCCTRKPVLTPDDFAVLNTGRSKPRGAGELCIASYANFLIVNGGVIVPQYDDENDALALEQLSAVFPDRKVVGVRTREIVYGGGNIRCITQQVPDPAAV